mmetsp:Transcript_8424/g.20845  ORF Transcript_8424/g.20845 Transcript_8424/m.20845 type:complete len:463 (+) Transcript_8424:1612-3000(+)
MPAFLHARLERGQLKGALVARPHRIVPISGVVVAAQCTVDVGVLPQVIEMREGGAYDGGRAAANHRAVMVGEDVEVAGTNGVRIHIRVGYNAISVEHGRLLVGHVLPDQLVLLNVTAPWQKPHRRLLVRGAVIHVPLGEEVTLPCVVCPEGLVLSARPQLLRECPVGVLRDRVGGAALDGHPFEVDVAEGVHRAVADVMHIHSDPLAPQVPVADRHRAGGGLQVGDHIPHFFAAQLGLAAVVAVASAVVDKQPARLVVPQPAAEVEARAEGPEVARGVHRVAVKLFGGAQRRVEASQVLSPRADHLLGGGHGESRPAARGGVAHKGVVQVEEVEGAGGRVRGHAEVAPLPHVEAKLCVRLRHDAADRVDEGGEVVPNRVVLLVPALQVEAVPSHIERHVAEHRGLVSRVDDDAAVVRLDDRVVVRVRGGAAGAHPVKVQRVAADHVGLPHSSQLRGGDPSDG